jgi:hypothetical protein
VSSLRGVWLGSHLLNDPAGAAAHAAAQALGPAVHARLLEAGDRLAASSAVLAQRYYRRAAAAWQAFGPDGFARWLALGEALASREPVSRDGAMAFFNVAPTGFGRGELDLAAAWCELGRALAATSPKLAAIFMRSTAALLRRPAALERLRIWVDVGRGCTASMAGRASSSPRPTFPPPRRPRRPSTPAPTGCGPAPARPSTRQ